METKQINSAETYHLSRFQINTFKDKGAIYLPEVENNENIKLLGPVITNAVEKFTVEKRSLEKRDTYGKAFLQVMNLWQRDEAVKEFTLKKKFAQIAAKLLNVDKVRIYHDQALFKEAGGGATPWHQDQYYWPLDTLNTVTMWMPLIDIDPSQLNKYETKIFELPTEKMIQFADYLNVSFDYLMLGEAQKQLEFENRALLNKLSDIEKLGQADQQVLRRMIDALNVQRKVESAVRKK